MTWVSALPVAVVAVAWILLPGLVLARAIGVRGIGALAMAPAVSIGSLAVVAVGAGALGVPWSPGYAAVGSLMLTPAVWVVVRAVRGPAPDGEPPTVHRAGWWAAIGGSTAAAVLATITAVLGIGGVDQISQTYDAVFHYNAVAEILDSGNASSLAVGALTRPGAAAAFYPAAWHGLVALVVESVAGWLPSASVPVVSNVVAIVVAGVVWPLSGLLLVRQVVGRAPVAVALAPVLAVGFVALPWSLLRFGVLWPNALALAMAPVALACVVTLCGLATDSVLSRGQAAVIGAVALVGAGLAHPNAVVSVAVLAIAPVLWWLARRLRELAAAGRRPRAALLAVAVLGVLGAGSAFVLTSPLLATVRSFDWPAFESPPESVVAVLLNATNGRPAAWALSVAVLAGVIAAAATPGARWLIPAHVVAGGLYVLAAAVESPTAAALTGLWYNDSYRLAAMLPITGLPLAVLGLLAVGRLATMRTARPPAVVPVVVAAVVLVLVSGGLYVGDHADDLRRTYASPPGATVLTAQHRAFLDRIAGLVPPDAVVAQNPWTGSALLWALHDRKVLFPHLDGTWDTDRRYLAAHLADAARNASVCAAAQRLDVRFVLTGGDRFWPADARNGLYPGIDAVVGAPGFDLVSGDDTGPYRLYRITACGATGTGVSG